MTFRRLVRRAALLPAALVVVTALALSACAPAGSDSEKSPGDGASAKPLTIGRTVDLDQFDPAVATAFGTTQTLQLVFDSLVRNGADGKLEPGLATSWKTTDDGRTITFQLRKNVKFHDGTPFTSKAVVATLKRVLDEKTASVVRSNLLSITDVTAPDDTTAVLTLKQPDASVLSTLTSTGTSILSPADITSGAVSRKANGTGPFKLTERTQGQSVTLTANKDYWGGAPKLSGVQFRVIPDESSLLAALRAGSLDAGVLTDPTIVSQVGSGLTVSSTPTLAYHALMLNGRRAPLDNLLVRQAIACAINPKQVVDTAVAGEATVTGPITSPGYDLSTTEGLPCTPGDVGAAKQLLTKSGVQTPIALKALVMGGGYASAINEAQNVQSQLTKIGVNLTIDQQPSNVYVKRWVAADYDVTLALNGGNVSPYLMYARYFGDNASLSAPAGLDSPQIKALLQKANTDDDTARKQAVTELQQTMLKQSPWVWMFADNNVIVSQKDVKGLGIAADNSLRSLSTASRG